MEIDGHTGKARSISAGFGAGAGQAIGSNLAPTQAIEHGQTESNHNGILGSCFRTEATRKVLTVSELTGQVKRLLEKQVGQVWVTGEVTNFRAQSSGHFYFTLKDFESQVSCVLFRNEARDTRALVQDGRKIGFAGRPDGL